MMTFSEGLMRSDKLLSLSPKNQGGLWRSGVWEFLGDMFGRSSLNKYQPLAPPRLLASGVAL